FGDCHDGTLRGSPFFFALLSGTLGASPLEIGAFLDVGRRQGLVVAHELVFGTLELGKCFGNRVLVVELIFSDPNRGAARPDHDLSPLDRATRKLGPVLRAELT